MLSISKSEKILNSGEKKYTPEQVEQIRDFLYKIARIQVRAFLEEEHRKQARKTRFKSAA